MRCNGILKPRSAVKKSDVHKIEHLPPFDHNILFKVALDDYALTLRDDVEIGFVPPAVADRKRGQVAGLVGPGLAICAAAC